MKANPSSHLTTWKVLEDKITSKANLVRRGIGMTTITCCLCRRRRKPRPIFFVLEKLSGSCGLSATSG